MSFDIALRKNFFRVSTLKMFLHNFGTHQIVNLFTLIRSKLSSPKFKGWKLIKALSHFSLTLYNKGTFM